MIYLYFALNRLHYFRFKLFTSQIDMSQKDHPNNSSNRSKYNSGLKTPQPFMDRAT